MADQTPQDPQDPQTPAEETPAVDPTPAAAEETPAPAAEETPAPAAEETPAPAAEETPEPVAEAPETPEAAGAASAVPQAADAPAVDQELEEEPPAPRVKPAIPGADLDVDIVLDGGDRPSWSEDEDPDAEDATASDDDEDELLQEPIAAQIQLADDARYRATGKRKTAIARVILKPGTGVYTINGRTMDDFFPRATLQKTIRQPLEAVGFEDRMDVVARMHGGGVSAQAGALRHGISRALLEADPNLRTELKKRGFLTRDARAKERKKAGLKKARKKPQFSKR
jgi:small subunit ribosomal protein S9